MLKKTTQPPKHTKIDHLVEIKQSGKRTEGQMGVQHANTYSGNCNQNKIRMDHQETR